MLCPDCKLTPAGSYLMQQALEGMQRTRGDDPSWRPLICGRCGEVSGIIDDEQGWVFGREPRAAGAVVSG
jgi:hypothetical protein